jgi:ParB family chromosome partitioning protein
MPENDAALVPDQVGVKQIPTNKLIPNPHNPRMLFDKEPLAILRESIAKVGILVPLTVYWSAQRKSFVILDGQRRWMCAQQLERETVPVNQVAEPTLVQNIVTMFQIHKLREDWELMPTALKVELLMKELGERRDRQLAELTGLDEAVIVRCRKLLSFDRKHQDLMLAAEPGDRVKADFFIELYAVLSDRTVGKMPWFKRDRFIDRMLDKYRKRSGLKAVTDFRTIKQHIRNAAKAKRVSAITRRLQEFADQDDVPLSHLEIPEASTGAEARRLAKLATQLSDKLRTLEPDTLYGEKALWDELEKLSRLIRKVLIGAGRRPH